MNQYRSCKLGPTCNSWAMNVQCSYNNLKRQLAVHNAHVGAYSFFMRSKPGVLCCVRKARGAMQAGFIMKRVHNSSPLLNDNKVLVCIFGVSIVYSYDASG